MQCYPRGFGPRATLHNFRAKFFSVDLGTTQYLYIVAANKFTALLPFTVCLVGSTEMMTIMQLLA